MQKVFLFLFVGVLGVLVGHQVQRTSTIVNDVLMENVEALADAEAVGPITCWRTGDLTCPNYGEKVGSVYKGYSLR